MKGLQTDGRCAAINSVAQVLHATAPLREWCRERDDDDDDDTVAGALCGLFRDMDREDGRAILPSTSQLKLAVAKYAAVEFDDFEDPDRILNCLLNGLPPAATRLWTIEKRVALQCAGCDWATDSLMRDNALHVYAPDDNEDEPVALQDLVDYAYVVDDRVCDTCNKEADLRVTETIVTTPRVLRVTISRLIRSGNPEEPTKLVTSVRFDQRLTVNKRTYELYGVITHLGHVQRGHIRAYVKRDDAWFRVDDASVTECEWSDVARTRSASCAVGEIAYVLMYLQC